MYNEVQYKVYLELEYKKMAILLVQYSTVHGSRIRVQQQDGGFCRYDTVWYKLYLG